MLRKISAALVAPLFLMAACSGNGGDGAQEEVGTGTQEEAAASDAALAALRAAPDAAIAAGSGRVEMTMSMTVDGETVELTATGAFSGARSSMELDFGALFAGGADAAGQELPPGLDEPMQVVVDGTTMYMRWPLLTMMGAGAEWVSVSPEDMGIAADTFGGGWAATNNPAQMLDTLRGVSDGDLEPLGTEDVRGTAAAGYRVVVDLAKAAEQMPEDLRAGFEAALEDGPRTIPMEVWIDGDGLVRRLAVDLAQMVASTPAAGGEQLDAGSMTVDFFDYGADLDIAVPDPADTTPFDQVMGGAGGAMG